MADAAASTSRENPPPAASCEQPKSHCMPRKRRQWAKEFPFQRDKQSGLFKCHMCNYKTSFRGSLRSHYASHSTVRPFECDGCPYKAKRSSDLRKHIQLKHGRILPLLRRFRNAAGVLIKKEIKSELLENEEMTENSVDPGEQKDPSYTPRKAKSSRHATSVFPEPQIPGACTTNNPQQHNVGTSPVQHATGGMQHASAGMQLTTSGTHQQTLNSSPHEHSAGISPEASGDVNTSAPGTAYVKPEPPDDGYDTSGRTKSGMMVCRPCVADSPGAVFDELWSSSAGATHGTGPGGGFDLEDCLESQEFQTVQSITSPIIPRNLQRRNPHSSPYHRDTARAQMCSSSPVHTHQASSSMYTESRPQSDDASSHSSCHLPSSSIAKTSAAQTKRDFHCHYCNILFFDGAIYFMHMGLHNQEDPWRCNLCGDVLHDVYSFTSHFVNGHSSNNS